MTEMTPGILLSAIPPFSPNLIADVQEMLRHDFMAYALLAGTIIALAAGAVSFFIVLRRQAFAGDALADVAFAGGLGAAVLGLPLLLGLFGGTVAVALGIGVLGGRTRARDVAIGTVLAWVLGLGALFLKIYTSTASGSNGTVGVNILFGTIFGLQAQQAYLAAWIAAGALALLLFIARPLLFASLDPEVAAARGVPGSILDLAFLALVGITVAEAAQAVGVLLIFSLLVAPGAIAQRLVTRPFRALALSVALALAIIWVGLTIAFYASYPPSFLISALAFGLYLVIWLFQQGRIFWTHRLRTRLSPSKPPQSSM
jgi:zinc/manganese transport system permease protein